MANLLVVILYDPSQLPALLSAWRRIGVPGVTILESAGGQSAAAWLSRFGLESIGNLLRSGDVSSKTLLTVIDDEELLERAIIEADRLVEDFSMPNRGLLFVVPVSRALGNITARTEPAEALSQVKPPEALTDRAIVTRDTPVSDIDRILNLEPIIVPADQPLIEVVAAMINFPNVHVACVVNKQQRLIGLLSLPSLAEDLLMAVVPEELLREAHGLEEVLHFADMSRSQTAAEAMTPAVWVTNEDKLKNAFIKMHDNQLTGIPIVNERYEVIGYINLLELLAVYAGSQNDLTT